MHIENSPNTQWLPLVDYAVRHDISLSTLRRYIKSGKIIYKVEAGKYLVQEEIKHNAELSEQIKQHLAPVELKILELENNLKLARREITELRTLLAFYEEQIPGRSDA